MKPISPIDEQVISLFFFPLYFLLQPLAYFNPASAPVCRVSDSTGSLSFPKGKPCTARIRVANEYSARFYLFSIVSPSRWLIPSAKRHERQSGRRRDDSRGEKQSTPHRISSESSKVTYPRLLQSFFPFCSLSSANFVFSTSNLRLPYVFTSISPFRLLVIFIRIRRWFFWLV